MTFFCALARSCCHAITCVDNQKSNNLLMKIGDNKMGEEVGIGVGDEDECSQLQYSGISILQ